MMYLAESMAALPGTLHRSTDFGDLAEEVAESLLHDTMIVSLPTEIICTIAEHCPLRDQASLARSCVRLNGVCNYILYSNDVRNHRCSSVFHAIAWCHDQTLALRILAAAKVAGTDFKQCHDARNHHPLSFHQSDTTLHSPIHLAARRGLDEIVAFLISQGISPDGLAGVCRTPLAEAILYNQESTAILLVRKGAHVGFQPPNFDAYCAAVRQGLPALIKTIVRSKGIDVNTDVGYGCTALKLAVCHRRKRALRVLLSLGADAKAVLRDFCRNHTFSSLLWTLEAGAPALLGTIGLKGLLDLVFAVAIEQVSPIQKSQQVIALQTLLELLQRARSGASSGPTFPTEELHCFLDALLQRMLSVARTDAAIASMLLQYGARVRAGIFLQLLGTLKSTGFANDTLRCLRRHPKLLQSLDFVYTYCAHLPAAERSFTIDYFIENIPEHAVRLVDELKRYDLPLTVRGVERMTLRVAEGSREAESGNTA